MARLWLISLTEGNEVEACSVPAALVTVAVVLWWFLLVLGTEGREAGSVRAKRSRRPNRTENVLQSSSALYTNKPAGTAISVEIYSIYFFLYDKKSFRHGTRHCSSDKLFINSSKCSENC